MTDETVIEFFVDKLARRFLTWRLPENFNPDNGISFKPTYNDHMPCGPMKCNPSGTNLFDYDQAREMVRHMIGVMPLQSTTNSTVDETLNRARQRHADDSHLYETITTAAAVDKAAESLEKSRDAFKMHPL